MAWDEPIDQGKVLVVTDGTYSDYHVYAVLRALRPVTLRTLLEEFKGTDKFLVMISLGVPDGSFVSNLGWHERFVDWMVKEEYFEDLCPVEANVVDAGVEYFKMEGR